MSLKIAILNSIIATVLGTMAALALGRMRRRSRVPFDVIVYLTLVVPEIVIAVATLIFFVQLRNEVGSVFPRLGWVTILIAHVVFNASIVMLIVRARFVGMGQTLEEASFDLGARADRDVPPGDAAAARARPSSPRRCSPSRSRSTTT